MKNKAKKVLSLALVATMAFSTVLFGNGLSAKAADVTVGEKDYSSPFWGAHSEPYTVAPHTSSTVSLTNHSAGPNSWNNFIVVLNDPDTEKYDEICVVRADNWGWNSQTNTGVGLETLGWTLESNWNWDMMVSDMSEAEVTVTVVNHDGSTDVLCDIVGASGAEYFQNYKNIPTTGNVEFHFTVEGCYLDIHEGVVTKEADDVFAVTTKDGKAVEDVAVTAGSTLEYVGTYNPTSISTDKEITWSSSDKKVATVENGVVKALAAGKTTITAKAFTHEVSFVVTVSAKEVPTKDFEVSVDKAELKVKETAQIKTELLPADTTQTSNFKFESSDKKVVKVDAEGKVTAVGAGKASVKVTNTLLKTSKSVDFVVSGSVKKTSTTEKKTTTVTVGSKDCSTGWWTAFSDVKRVKKGETVEVSFKNYTGGGNNWDNFLVVLQNVADAHSAADNAKYAEYAVVRADNYGWSGANNTFDNGDELGWTLESNWNWDEFKTIMNGADVTVAVTNNGKTADVKCTIKGSDGNEYFQNYLGIPVSGDLYFCNTVEKGYLEFVGEYEVEKAVFDTKDIYTTEALSSSMKDAIQSVNGGGSVEFTAPEGTKVEKALIQALIDKGVEVTISSDKAAFTFAKLSNAVDFDPSVTVGGKVEAIDKALAKVKGTMVDVSFAHAGKLPGTAEVAIDLSKTFKDGKTVYLYYYNAKTGKFELTDSAKVSSGKATFTMKHCSDYVVTADKLPSSVTGKVVQTGDTNKATLPMVLVIAGLGMIALVLVSRKKLVK